MVEKKITGDLSNYLKIKLQSEVKIATKDIKIENVYQSSPQNGHSKASPQPI